MIYTSYEMVGDCREGKSAGWRHFIKHYVPVVRRILHRYGRGEGETEGVLTSLRTGQTVLFQVLEPVPERPFVAELRQAIVGGRGEPTGVVLDLETMAGALAPLTLVEKQTVWLETMWYTPEETGELLRMSVTTVEKIRGRGADLIRGGVDSWNSRMLKESGRALGREAAAARGKDCLQAKTFLDVLDGRSTWRGREEMEQHVLGCWHCIDHFCRLIEVGALLKGVQPLGEEEAEPFYKLVGAAAEKRGGLSRFFGRLGSA